MSLLPTFTGLRSGVRRGQGEPVRRREAGDPQGEPVAHGKHRTNAHRFRLARRCGEQRLRPLRTAGGRTEAKRAQPHAAGPARRASCPASRPWSAGRRGHGPVTGRAKGVRRLHREVRRPGRCKRVLVSPARFGGAMVSGAVGLGRQQPRSLRRRRGRKTGPQASAGRQAFVPRARARPAGADRRVAGGSGNQESAAGERASARAPVAGDGMPGAADWRKAARGGRPAPRFGVAPGPTVRDAARRRKVRRQRRAVADEPSGLADRRAEVRRRGRKTGSGRERVTGRGPHLGGVAVRGAGPTAVAPRLGSSGAALVARGLRPGRGRVVGAADEVRT